MTALDRFGNASAPKVLGFNFGRMNPIQGIGRMFSVHGLAEMIKAILKSLLVGGVAALVLWLNIDHLFDLMVEPLEVGMVDFSDTVAFAALMIVLSLGLLALIDVPFQLWQYHKKLRMTKEEVKRESKEQEGDPMVKGRIRALQREMARRRMMTEVPKADVVVTNPTHFSVALRYRPGVDAAPVVVARGRGDVALSIRELARGANVPLGSARIRVRFGKAMQPSEYDPGSDHADRSIEASRRILERIKSLPDCDDPGL